MRFLDPCTKSGVFLREITSRLTEGLADEIPDLEERVDHILTKQVFGIGITHLTSLLARRSVYCSKHANGTHSIAKSFATDDGNIWFERIEHTWVDGQVQVLRRQPDTTFDRGEGLETHAYAFIHTDDIKARIAELFGGDMQFDVIIGNPPYQLGQSGGDADERRARSTRCSSSRPRRLNPRFLVDGHPVALVRRRQGPGRVPRARCSPTERLRTLVDYPRRDGRVSRA